MSIIALSLTSKSNGTVVSEILLMMNSPIYCLYKICWKRFKSVYIFKVNRNAKVIPKSCGSTYLIIDHPL